MLFILLSLTYQIQITDDINFNTIIVDEITTENVYFVINPLTDDTYYWRVRSNENELWSEWSNVWNFTIDTYIPPEPPEAPPIPILVSPLNNSVISDSLPVFNWLLPSIYDAINRPPANGNTLYVGLDGNDSYTYDDAQNYDTPWKTINYGINQLIAGDMLIVKDGIYNEGKTADIFAQLWRRGVKDNWIIIKSENLFGAKIDGQNSFLYGLNLEDSTNFVWIEGFEFYGFRTGAIWNNQSNHDVYYYKNYVHDVGRNITDPSYSGGFSGFKTNYYSWNITIDGNIIHTIGRLPHAEYESHDYKHDHGIYAQGCRIRILNNLIYDCNAGWGIKVDGNRMNLSGSSHIITNNTFAYHTNPYRVGHIRFYSNPGLDYWSKDVIIQNNIFYAPGNAAISKSARDYSAIIRNNLMTCDTIVWNESSEIDPINMQVYDNIKSTDPLFVDYIGIDFHIQSGSPCIDFGISQFAPGYDFDGILRPQLSDYDIGAYEKE